MHLAPIREAVVESPGRATALDWSIYVLGCGYLGVPVFFVISGYCICAAAVNHHRRGHGIKRYIFRRIRRIYPAYWSSLVLLFALCVFPAAQLDPLRLTPSQWFGNLFLFEQWRPHVFGSATQYFSAVAWTLCYEEQFYFLVGLVLVTSPRALFFVFAALTLFVGVNEYGRFVLPNIFFENSVFQSIPIEGFVWDKFWLFFASGISLFLFRNSMRNIRFILPVVIALLIVWELRQMDWYSNRFQSRVAGFGISLWLMTLTTLNVPILRGMVQKVACWLGDRTYSIYLVHLPLVFLVRSVVDFWLESSAAATVLLTVPLSVIVSIAVGHFFFLLLERPFLPSRDSRLANPRLS